VFGAGKTKGRALPDPGAVAARGRGFPRRATFSRGRELLLSLTLGRFLTYALIRGIAFRACR